ncbi:MAG: RNA-binding protein [Candidatus Marinimicrobia bacterium]|nr:RNA-binding protein [Candidatus Neomarinimicrobiota bacterium]
MHKINSEFFIPLKKSVNDQLAKKIYITNLSSDVDVTDLRKIFETVGVIVDVKVVNTATSNEPTGLGYVEVGNQFDFGRAFKELNGKKIKGCYLTLFDRRYSPERRIISDRRQNTDRRKMDMVPLLQLNEITSAFIEIDNQEQVERRGDIDRRIVRNRRISRERRD